MEKTSQGENRIPDTPSDENEELDSIQRRYDTEVHPEVRTPRVSDENEEPDSTQPRYDTEVHPEVRIPPVSEENEEPDSTQRSNDTEFHHEVRDPELLRQQDFQSALSSQYIRWPYPTFPPQMLRKLLEPEPQVVLLNEDIWKTFRMVGTEMILTKSGRRMFPLVKVQLSNLDPSKFYNVLLDIVLVDQMRYKFMNMQWVPFQKTNIQQEISFYNHKNSPALGSKWMQEPITFTEVKLSNYEKSDEPRIILRSMHKYRVRIHVVQCSDIAQLYYSNFHTFDFPQTTFIAVTTYQNDKVANLKIEKNPFARAFKIGSKKRSENESSKANSSENVSPSDNRAVATTSAKGQMEPQYQNSFASFPNPSNSIPLGYPNYPFHSMPFVLNRYSPCNYLQPINQSFNPWSSYQHSINPQPLLSPCSCLNCSSLRCSKVSTASIQSCCGTCSICNSAVSSTTTENKKTQ